ncbi:MAG: hypothetical protein ACREBQ_06155 [Nitrososphaerales archaeon]
MNWRRLFFISVGFGAGFAVAAFLIGAFIYWYVNRPKPWDKAALKATFATMEIDTQPQAANYKTTFLYDIENQTDRSYDFNSYNLTLLAVLAEGNALSKEFGHYQAEEPKIDGPAFIPAHGKARVQIVVYYAYPQDWNTDQKSDVNKVVKSFDHRLRELNGFVVFDNNAHYEIDMPEGWQNSDDVKSLKN